jgi:zinc protease
MTLFQDVQRKVLDNGLEILVREDRSAPVVALNFFVRVGSLNEDEAIAGWSHGIEHMLFKGTSRRGPGDIAREILDAGGDTNAGTSYESTNYYITLPAENFETALDIHADVLMHSTFDASELEKERQVLIKENEMYRDRPSGYGFTWEHLLAEAFTTHRYRNPIGGPDENLLRVGRDAILAYKETYYVPNNIVYVVVGDVSADRAFQAIEERLGGWPARPLAPSLSPPEPPQIAFRYRETAGDVEKVYVKIGFHVPPELHADTDAILVLAGVLGSGRSSRLYLRVREGKDLILSSSILDTTGREPGYLVVEFAAETAKADAALAEVMAQILRFQVEPPSATELERTLRMHQGETLHTLETMEGQASILGHYALLGDYRLAGTYLERLVRVDAARVQDAARRYLNLEQATVYVHAPEGARPEPPAPATLYDRLRTSVAGALAPLGHGSNGNCAPNVLPVGSGTGRGPVEALTLSAGTRVLLQRDGRLPLAALAAYLPVGSGNESDGDAGITRLTQLCMMKGAEGRSAAEISQALEGMGARLHPFTSRDVCGFSLSAVSRDLPAALDLFRAVLTRPDFPEEAVTRERRNTQAELAALRDDTMQFTLSEFYRRLFAGHPYGRLVAGTEDSVERLDGGALRAWHARAYDPARLVLSVVGDFDREDLLRRLEDTVCALPARGPAPAEVPPPPPARAGERFALHKDVAQAVVVLGYPGPGIDAPERYALEVWEAILSGMGNRLFTRLRDERHLCYFTGAFAAPLRRAGTVGAYVGTGPEQADEATTALLAELELTAREAPAADELRRARNTLAGSHLIDMQSRMAWAATYAHDEVLGLGYEETARYLDGIRSVTAEEVRRAAERVIDPALLTVTVLRPDPDGAAAGERAST